MKKHLISIFALALSLRAAETGVFIGGIEVEDIHFMSGERSASAAACDLQKYLLAVAGRKLGLKADDPTAKNGIFIGGRMVPQDILKRIGPPGDHLEYMARVAVPGALYLWGSEIGQSHGNRWAASCFIERELGVRWLWPGELGEKIPGRKKIEIAVGSRMEVPSFQVRCYPWLYFGLGGYYTQDEMREMREWALIRHRFGSTLEGHGGMGFGHAFARLVPQERFGREHPEWYSLVSPGNWCGSSKPGRPTRTNGNPDFQLCTSNPRLRQLVADEISALHTDRIVSISPNDGYMFCECENCRKLDGTRWQSLYDKPDLSNRIFDFAADVCARVKRKNPEGKLGMFAYSFFSGAPDCLERLPDNLYLSMTYRCASFRDPETKRAFEERIGKFGRLQARFIGREYWSDHTIWSMPWLHTKLIAENLKFIKAHGAVGIYGEAGRDWANNALNYYVLARLMWDSTLNLDDIVDDFCRNAFGDAAGIMKRYFNLLETHVDEYYANRVRRKLPMNHDSYAGYMTMFEELYTPKFVRKAQGLLDAAGRMAHSVKDKERVEFFRIGIKYAGLFGERLRIYRRAVACGAHLVFIRPAEGLDCIDDELIGRTFAEAERVSRNQLYYLLRHQGRHAVDSGVYLYIGKASSMPWDRTIQEQKLIHQKGFYNYLVNGAFEYDFAWDFAVEKGDATHRIDVGRCHDHAYDFMALCHGGQGRSLEVTCSPGSVLAIRSSVRIRTPAERLWQLSGFVRRPDGVLLEASLEYGREDGSHSMSLEMCRDEVLRDSGGWEPVRFRPAKLPVKQPTSMRLVIRVMNPSVRRAVVNLDGLALKIAR